MENIDIFLNNLLGEDIERITKESSLIWHQKFVFSHFAIK